MRKSLEKKTKSWWKFKRFCIFWLQFLLKNHYLTWLNGESPKIKIYFFEGLGGGVKAPFSKILGVWGLGVSINHWYLILILSWWLRSSNPLIFTPFEDYLRSNEPTIEFERRVKWARWKILERIAKNSLESGSFLEPMGVARILFGGEHFSKKFSKNIHKIL